MVVGKSSNSVHSLIQQFSNMVTMVACSYPLISVNISRKIYETQSLRCYPVCFQPGIFTFSFPWLH